MSVKASNDNQWWSTDTFVMNVQCLPKSSNGVIVLQICTLSCDAKSDWMSHVWSITTIEGFSLFVLRPQRTKPFYHLWMTLSESKRCCQKLGNATTADCGFNLTKPTQYLTLYSFRRFLCFFQRQSVMKYRHVWNACIITFNGVIGLFSCPIVKLLAMYLLLIVLIMLLCSYLKDNKQLMTKKKKNCNWF